MESVKYRVILPQVSGNKTVTARDYTIEEKGDATILMFWDGKRGDSPVVAEFNVARIHGWGPKDTLSDGQAK